MKRFDRRLRTAGAIFGPRPIWLVVIGLLILGTIAAGMPGCGKRGSGPKLLVVGIDGADWEIMAPLLQAGKLPNLSGLIDRGVSAPLMSMYPIISPVIWTSIATGKGPDQHGILDFTMPDPQSGRPIVVASTLRRSKAFWNILSDQGQKVCVVGWWGSWPAEDINGVIASDRINYHAFIDEPQANDGLVSPANKTDEILALRKAPADLSYDIAREFIDVTPEEYAAAPAQDFHNPISHFRQIYQTMASNAAIALRLIEKERPDVMAVYFEGVDTACHLFLRYAPPDYPYTTAEDRRKFGRTPEAFYVYQDRLLGELLAAAGDKTNVLICSDHGFLTGRERPVEQVTEVTYATASRWHRLYGVLIMAGPQVRQAGNRPNASPIKQASVFDVTPTILALAGVAPATDMEGRVLTEGLADGVAVPTAVTTYEDAAWRENRAAARASLVEGADEAMKEQLRSLGYIGANEYEETLSLRAQWGLAEYYMFRRKLNEAESTLVAVTQRSPNLPESYYLLGVIYSQRKEYDRAREMFEKCLSIAPDKIEARFELATIHRAAGRRAEAISALEPALASHPYDIRLLLSLGMLERETGNAQEALKRYDAALAIAPDNHDAHAQSALACEDLNRPAEAARHWAAALRARPDDRIAQQHLQALRDKGYGGED